MRKYLEKRLEELRERQYNHIRMDVEDKTSVEYRLNEAILNEIKIRISETESHLAHCKENRKPVFIDIDKSMAAVEGLLANIDSEINADSNYYKACQIAYNSTLQLQIQQKD
mgnify:CR=1 FL=1